MRIGIFGGSFDPPHRGHREVVRTAMESPDLQLDRLLVIPCAFPIHRVHLGGRSFAERVGLAALSVSGEAGVEISAIEGTLPAPSHTLQTLQALMMEREAEWVVIIGADQAAQFSTWNQPEEILKLAELAVIERPGSDGQAAVRQLRAQYPESTIHLLPLAVTISSSEIRQLTDHGLPADKLLTCAVRKELERHRQLQERSLTSDKGQR